MNKNKSHFIYQLFEGESSTYTYIIADMVSMEAAIIDPVLETVARDLQYVDELGFKLKYSLETHIHADHITGGGEIRKCLGVKTVVSCMAPIACADIMVDDQSILYLGDKKIKVIMTPGHTDTCVTYYFEGSLFTGDSLLIRTCGRTDFQQGSSEKLFNSIREKLFIYPDDTIVYPGHDYRGFTSTTIGQEKKYNSRLKLDIDKMQFYKIMADLKLPQPKKIHHAVPANLACGILKKEKNLKPAINNGIPEISCEQVHELSFNKNEIHLIDVRRPEEFNNELGHIAGAVLKTLGPELSEYLKYLNKEEEIIFICRSGARSENATLESLEKGFRNTANMVGGMIRWNQLLYPIVRGT